MITTSHGILAFLFNRYLNRKCQTKIHPFYIMLGSMLPDFFHIINTVISFMARTIFLTAWHSELLLDISKFLHSFPVFCITFAIYFSVFFFIKRSILYSRVLSFFFGWGFFHILIDVFTHRSLAWPYFWPWTDVPVYGLIDHSNPLLIITELIFSGYLLSLALKKPKKNKP